MKRLAIVAALALAGAAAPSAPFLLREQGWTHASSAADLAHALTHAPSECAAARTPQSEIGRALFRSPALLGGPAARIGLSCHACHTNGRANARFLLPELTDRAGAADVTSEWSSRVRGDGVLNPVAIPDLAGAAARTAFGRARDPSLAHFVRGVIVEEFQGREPTAQAIDGLTAYVRGQDVCAGEAPITLAAAEADIVRAVAAAEAADAPTAHLLLYAAQDAIGRLVERLPAQTFAHERRRFELLSRTLGRMRHATDLHATMRTSLPEWRQAFAVAIAAVTGREDATYFNEATLRRALDG